MAFSAFPLLILILVFPSDLVTIETGEDSFSLRTSTNTTEERAGSNIVIMKNYYNSCFTMHKIQSEIQNMYLIISDTLKGCSMSTINKCYGIHLTNEQKLKKLIEVSLFYIIECML